MKALKVAAVTMTLVGAAAIGLVSPTAAYAADNSPWEIFPQHAVGKCVEVAGGSTANNAQIQIYNCPTNTGGITPLKQRWFFRPSGNGYVRLVSGVNGKCINIAGNADVNGANIIQYTCGSSASTLNDQWLPSLVRTDANARDWYMFQSRLDTSKCLNVKSAGTANGTDLILYTCTTNTNGVFSWSPAKQT